MEDNWQPIETAPKDGAVLIGYWRHLGRDAFLGDSQLVMRWYDSGWTALPAIFDCLKCGASTNGWSGYQPTHWMPLPNPPRQPMNGEEAK